MGALHIPSQLELKAFRDDIIRSFDYFFALTREVFLCVLRHRKRILKKELLTGLIVK
jgi:hypothetical protein